MNRKKSSISLYPAEQIPPIVDKYEYEVGATVNNVHKTRVRFLREHLKYYKYEGAPLNYGLDLIQEAEESK